MVATALGGTLAAEIHGVTITPVAAQFTAANSESLTVADNAALSFGSSVDATFAGWVYFDTLADFETLFAKDDVAGTSMEYRLIIGAPGNPVFQVSPDGTAGAAVSVGWTDVLEVDSWYFVSCQYDGAEITISINRGSPAATAYTGDIFDGNDTFALGSDGEGDFFYLDGRLDAWGIWKRVLTDAELSYLYNAGRARRYQDLDTAIKTDMVAWWGLNETSGNRADSHGANTLTDNNTVTSDDGVDVVSLLGYIAIDSAQDTDAINEIGSAVLTCRATPAHESLARVGREIRLFAEGDGEVWRGFINMRDWAVTPSEQRSMSLQCLTLDGRELQRRNTFRGIEVTDDTVGNALDAILSETGWSGLVTGSGYATDITKRWDNATRFNAALELGKIAGGYVRRTASPRQIELKNEFADSGIILRNIAHLGPEIGPSNPTYGAVSGIRKLLEDGNRIVNRVAAFGKTDGDAYFGLEQSDRSSPYAIKVTKPIRASVTNIVRGQGSFDASGSSDLAIEIEVLGKNRAVLVALFKESSWAARPFVNGRVMSLFDAAISFSGSDSIQVWILTGVDAGVNTITVEGSEGATTFSIDMIAVALKDVDQFDPEGDRDDKTGTGTAVATDAFDVEDGDLAITFLGYDSQVITATPSSGFEVVEFGTHGSAPTSNLYVSTYDVVGDDSITPGYTLSGSETWAVIGLNVRSARLSYIEDQDSIDAYGLSELVLALGDYQRLRPGQATEAANTMYDRSVADLLRLKDPPTAYDVDVLWLPDDATWMPGDSMAVDIYDEESGLTVDDDLIVVKRTRSWGPTGEKRWNLTLSTLADLQDEVGDWVALVARVHAIQANQV